MNKEDVKRYFQYDSVTEFYNQFKIDFFKLIDENLADWSASDLLKKYYNNYEFDVIRLLLDDRVETWSTLCNNCISEGESMGNYYMEYKKWKKVEDYFLAFIDIYDEKIKKDLIV